MGLGSVLLRGNGHLEDQQTRHSHILCRLSFAIRLQFSFSFIRVTSFKNQDCHSNSITDKPRPLFCVWTVVRGRDATWLVRPSLLDNIT